MRPPLRITSDREVQIKGFAEKLGLDFNKLNRKEKLVLYQTQVHIHDVLLGGKDRIAAPPQPTLEDYKKEVQKENPGLADKDLDKKIQEAEQQHKEVLQVSLVVEAEPPALVDLNKVLTKDTMEAISAADENESPDMLDQLSKEIVLNPSIGAIAVHQAPGTTVDDQKEYCWQVIRNFLDAKSQTVSIQTITELVTARKLNRPVGWMTKELLQTLTDAIGAIPEKVVAPSGRKPNVTFNGHATGMGMGILSSTPNKQNLTEFNSQFMKGMQELEALPDVRLEARPRSNPYKPLIRVIDKIKADYSDAPDHGDIRQIMQFLRRLLRMIETASQQIKRITQVYPRFLQVPRSQEVLVEYMTDRFILELLIDTVSRLRELMVTDGRLEDSTTAWIHEDGYLTQIVIDNLLESYPLAQESNFVERSLPPYVVTLNEYYLSRLGQDLRQKYDHLSGEFWQILNEHLEAPGGIRLYTLRLMAQECLNNQVTESGQQLMSEPVMTALAQQTVTPKAIVQQALRGERITSEDKYRAILSEAASRKKEQEKQRKDRENLEKENLQLLREDKKDTDMMQNIAEFQDKIKEMKLDEDTKKMVFQGMLFKSVFQPKEQPPAPAPKGSTIQLKELGIHSLKTFSGDQHEYAIKQFLKRMDMMRKLRKWTDEEAVVAMETLSTGAAAEWWDNQRMASKPFLNSYEQTKIELLLRWYQSTTLGEKSDIRARLRFQPEKHRSHLDFYDECERKSFIIHDSGLAMEDDMDVTMTRGEFRKQDTLMSFIAGCSKEIKREIIRADAKTWPAVKEVVTLTESALRGCENEPRPNQRMLPGYNVGAIETTSKTPKETVSAIQNKPEPICWHCSKKGHLKRDCFLLKDNDNKFEGNKRNYRGPANGAPEASAVRARRGRFNPKPNPRKQSGAGRVRRPIRRFRGPRPSSAPKGRVLSVTTVPSQSGSNEPPLRTEVHHHYANPNAITETGASPSSKVSTVNTIPLEGARQSWETL